jgi:hypothetical protein
LASPNISVQGATLTAQGGGSNFNYDSGGSGRVRVETASGSPTGTLSSGSFPTPIYATLNDFVPTSAATITVMSWYDSTTQQWKLINQDPKPDATNAVQLPSTGIIMLRIEGHGVPAGTSIEVRTTYSLGNAAVVTAQVGTTSGNPPPGTTWTDVSVNFQLGVSGVQVRTQHP